METIQKELVIVGGGSAGYAAALRAARQGMDVALVDAGGLGGACLNRGCIPTKALLESSHLFERVRSGVFGITGETVLNMDAVFARKDQLVGKLSQGIASLLQAGKVAYFHATAKFVGDKCLALSSGEQLYGEKILLAVGAKPVLPRSIQGIELAKTSDDVLAHRFESCKRVAVIGGGVIGVELATFFSEAGSAVTILEGLPRILSPFSVDVTKYIGLALRRSGVKVVVNANITRLEKAGSPDDKDAVNLFYDEKGKEKTLTADLVLVCVGRCPVGIEGMESNRIVFDRGIVTDATCQTAHPEIFAVGDCAKGSIQLAHFATAQALSIVDRLAGKPVHTQLTCLPACVYTTPPVAKVGLSEAEAKAAGKELEVGKFNLGGNGKSLIAGEERGYVKVAFEKGSEILLGIEMVAAEAPEIIGGLSTLVAMGVRRSDILKSIYPHPSVCEAFFEAVEDSHQQAIHVLYR